MLLHSNRKLLVTPAVREKYGFLYNGFVHRRRLLVWALERAFPHEITLNVRTRGNRLGLKLRCDHSFLFYFFLPLPIDNPPGNPQNRLQGTQENHQKMRNVPWIQTVAFSSNFGFCGPCSFVAKA